MSDSFGHEAVESSEEAAPAGGSDQQHTRISPCRLRGGRRPFLFFPAIVPDFLYPLLTGSHSSFSLFLAVISLPDSFQLHPRGAFPLHYEAKPMRETGACYVFRIAQWRLSHPIAPWPSSP